MTFIYSYQKSDDKISAKENNEMIELFNVYEIDQTFDDLTIQKHANSRILFSRKGDQSWTWPIVEFDSSGQPIDNPTRDSDLDIHHWDCKLIRNRPTLIVALLSNTVIYYFDKCWIREIKYDQTYCTFNSDNIFFWKGGGGDFVGWDSRCYSKLPLTQNFTIDYGGNIYFKNRLAVSNESQRSIYSCAPIYWFFDNQYINIQYFWKETTQSRKWVIIDIQNHAACHIISPHVRSIPSPHITDLGLRLEELVFTNTDYSKAFKTGIESYNLDISSRYRYGDKFFVSDTTKTKVFGFITIKNARHFSQEIRTRLIYYLWIWKHSVVRNFIPKPILVEKIFSILVTLPEIM